MDATPHVDEDEFELSVVIPCLNEARSIGRCVDEALDMFGRFGIVGEVVVADNGSTDDSANIAAARGARVVSVPVRGYGSALRGGALGAHGTYVVFADADGQHDFDDIPRILDKLREGYELVVGNRFAGGIQPGSMTFSHRYIGNPIISGLLRLLFHPKIHDAQCGMRGFTREAFKEMDTRTTGFEFSPEMVVKAVRHHLRMTEVPITVKPDDRDRPPHLRTIPDGWRHLTFLLMCSPTWLFIIPGLFLLSLGLADVGWLATGEQHLGRIVLDTRDELFGILLASIGLNIASIGYFARVFSYSEPLRGTGPLVERVLSKVTLEQGLLTGAGLFLVGAIGAGVEVVRWATEGFHLFPNDRAVIFWSTFIVLGVQVGFASFFLSMLGISRKTWIGDER
jgi:glycosyltransferase involved in cell wall biosynthesis